MWVCDCWASERKRAWKRWRERGIESVCLVRERLKRESERARACVNLSACRSERASEREEEREREGEGEKHKKTEREREKEGERAREREKEREREGAREREKGADYAKWHDVFKVTCLFMSLTLCKVTRARVYSSARWSKRQRVHRKQENERKRKNMQRAYVVRERANVCVIHVTAIERESTQHFWV